MVVTICFFIFGRARALTPQPKKRWTLAGWIRALSFPADGGLHRLNRPLIRCVHRFWGVEVAATYPRLSVQKIPPFAAFI